MCYMGLLWPIFVVWLLLSLLWIPVQYVAMNKTVVRNFAVERVLERERERWVCKDVNTAVLQNDSSELV
jgi:hypothetical protein